VRPWLIAGIVVGADQLTKSLVARAFAPGDSLPLIPSVIHLTYVQNTGAAFGLFKGQQTVFVLLSIAIVAWVGWELLTQHPTARSVVWGCALVLGGAVGNLIDRVRFSYVIDFFDLRIWPVFNVADSAISIGTALLVWHALRPRSHVFH